MPPALAEKSELLGVHEQRIQKLEEGISDTRTDIALVDAKVDSLDKTIQQGMEALAAKMGEMVEAFKEHANQDSATAATVEAIVKRIENHDEARKMRLLRWKTWGKGAWAIIGGAVAVFMKEAAVALWKKYTHQ